MNEFLKQIIKRTLTDTALSSKRENWTPQQEREREKEKGDREAVLPTEIKAFIKCEERPFPLLDLSAPYLRVYLPLLINFLLPYLYLHKMLSLGCILSLNTRAEEYYRNPVTPLFFF